MSRVNKCDLEITHLKGSGPGGQNRNKRMSGVRVCHLPTGITIVATERRSQKQNLDAALERLEAKIQKLYTRPKPRKSTAPSQASTRKRLEEKKRKSIRKKLRVDKTGQWD